MERKILNIEEFKEDNFNCLVVDVACNSNKLTHIEYYIGVNKKHPLFQKNTTYLINDLRDHIFQKEVFSKKLSGKEGLDLIGEALITISDTLDLMQMSKDEIRQYAKNNKLSAIKHAWLSYIGNHYEYLNDNLCYFGGGMSTINFSEKDARVSARTMLKRMSKYLKEKKEL